MQKNTEISPREGFKLKPRGRSGGRPRTVPETEQKVQSNIKLPRWIDEALRVLVPLAPDRNKLFADWARAYVISNGESDRLLAQSPVAAELAAYLARIDAPQELRDKLESLIVVRVSDEVKIAEGVTKTKSGAYIV